MKNIQKSVSILGAPISRLTQKEAKEIISRCLEGKPRQVKIFTPNAEILALTHSDPSLLRLLSSAELSLADGIGIVAASYMLGDRLPCRITGIDTAEYILYLAARRGLSVFLLGARPGVAEAAASRLKERYKGLYICGTHHGYFLESEEEKEAVTKELLSSRPNILFACLGFPAQEEFICSVSQGLPSLYLSIGLGGCLDVWSGKVSRAPSFIQKCGLEWLYRIAVCPKRLWRIPRLFLFCFYVLQERLTGAHQAQRMS